MNVDELLIDLDTIAKKATGKAAILEDSGVFIDIYLEEEASLAIKKELIQANRGNDIEILPKQGHLPQIVKERSKKDKDKLFKDKVVTILKKHGKPIRE